MLCLRIHCIPQFLKPEHFSEILNKIFTWTFLNNRNLFFDELFVRAHKTCVLFFPFENSCTFNEQWVESVINYENPALSGQFKIQSFVIFLRECCRSNFDSIAFSGRAAGQLSVLRLHEDEMLAINHASTCQPVVWCSIASRGIRNKERSLVTRNQDEYSWSRFRWKLFLWWRIFAIYRKWL